MAAERDLYKRAPDEKIHWFVYVSPYEFRWDDDISITEEEKKQDDGRWLHTGRQRAAQKVLKRGSSSYVHRIQTIASRHGAVYAGLRKPQDFWDNLAKFPKESISRVWYFGHASKEELMLALAHDNLCEPGAFKSDCIHLNHISKHSHLADRFDPKTKEVSKFYGCYTSAFAEKWHSVFKVPAEGASAKIDFGVTDRPSSISNVLERLQKTPTSQGNPGWTRY